MGRGDGRRPTSAGGGTSRRAAAAQSRRPRSRQGGSAKAEPAGLPIRIRNRHVGSVVTQGTQGVQGGPRIGGGRDLGRSDRAQPVQRQRRERRTFRGSV